MENIDFTQKQKQFLRELFIPLERKVNKAINFTKLSAITFLNLDRMINEVITNLEEKSNQSLVSKKTRQVVSESYEHLIRY